MLRAFFLLFLLLVQQSIYASDNPSSPDFHFSSTNHLFFSNKGQPKPYLYIDSHQRNYNPYTPIPGYSISNLKSGYRTFFQTSKNDSVDFKKILVVENNKSLLNAKTQDAFYALEESFLPELENDGLHIILITKRKISREIWQSTLAQIEPETLFKHLNQTTLSIDQFINIKQKNSDYEVLYYFSDYLKLNYDMKLPYHNTLKQFKPVEQNKSLLYSGFCNLILDSSIRQSTLRTQYSIEFINNHNNFTQVQIEGQLFSFIDSNHNDQNESIPLVNINNQNATVGIFQFDNTKIFNITTVDSWTGTVQKILSNTEPISIPKESVFAISKTFSKDFISLSMKNNLNENYFQSLDKNFEVPVIVSTENPRNFHPQILLSIDSKNLLKSHHHIINKCSLGIMLPLSKNYFFDPYQLYSMKNKMGDISHFGTIELEAPAEAKNVLQWGSVLQLEFPTSNTARAKDVNGADITFDSINPFNSITNTIKIPIHARYRLPEIFKDIGFSDLYSNNKQTSYGYVYEKIKFPIVYWNCQKHNPTITLHSPLIDIQFPISANLVLISPNLLERSTTKASTRLFQAQIYINQSNTLSNSVDNKLEKVLIVRMPVPNYKLSFIVKWVTLLVVIYATLYFISAIYRHSKIIRHNLKAE
ncbi:hypothetical protein BB561_003110 [Smittium simulii]|uniref:Protein PBN1 n=1 Tax=Smittium simulii TaxID=133385 RepID=A0A2T9YMU6_9FUNG|nr:hypothetical protein BB561_003110 [Smittium simulii]